MSLYNMLNGFNNNAKIVLAMLNLELGDTGRFRDAWISSDGKTLSIFTRNGGGNREEYQTVIDELAKHPNYLRDFDNDFDCTYATIEFSVPDKYLDLVNKLKPQEQEKSLLEKKAIKKDEKFEECNGLMWSNSTKENVDWEKAKEFAKNCRDGGFDDWRLPTISELQNVFDYEKGESKIGGWDAGAGYWSATTGSNLTHYAWYTNQTNGITSSILKTDATISVRCVR